MLSAQRALMGRGANFGATDFAAGMVVVLPAGLGATGSDCAVDNAQAASSKKHCKVKRVRRHLTVMN
jgi:hypothetical protein